VALQSGRPAQETDVGALERVRSLCQRDIEANGLPVRIVATTDRAEVLRDARYVINTVRIGGLKAFEKDVEIPLKYGVDQCPGDTLGTGGLFYAQRTIAFLMDLCGDIRAHAEPDCLLLNHANPMAMNTWACLAPGGVRTVGLCHGVQHGHWMMAELLGVPMGELDIVCAGINHQTWYIRATHRGVDMLPRFRELAPASEYWRQHEPVRLDMMERFGYFSTESNGHLSEYLAWYRKRPEELARWIGPDEWIHGETGGYLRHCRETRKAFVDEFPKLMEEPAADLSNRERSLEHGSYIVEGLETGRIYPGHFNVRNRGVIANLPDDAVIEAPGYADDNGINMPVVGDLPLGCAAVCKQSIEVQRLGVEAAVKGDFDLLRQAMLLDPLTAAACTTDEVWRMAGEMLAAEAQWLPQYAGARPKA
jgi:alpha-galactosidase